MVISNGRVFVKTDVHEISRKFFQAKIGQKTDSFQTP